MLEEITAKQLEDKEVLKQFINKQVEDMAVTVGDGLAINALSGGKDSSVVTILGHKALGDNLRTYFIDNGLMRQSEPEQVVTTFRKLGVPVDLIDAKRRFLDALEGLTDPEEKREAITQTFYKDVFAQLVRDSGAKYLLQGTILTDIDETVAGIKRQHNVFEQIGIDPQEAFGYKIIEPVVQLRKDGVTIIAKALGLPESIYNRMPFPGPGLAARVYGEATPERIEIARKANYVVETILGQEKEKGTIDPFQYMAILHEDKVTGMRDNKRDYGHQIEVRCWDSIDARTATPTNIPDETFDKIVSRLTTEVPGVVSVTENKTPKPPSTMEAI